MSLLSRRRLGRLLRRFPNLLAGYNLYVNPQKLRLIDHAFSSALPGARSFADLGGVWRVNAAYTRYTLSRFGINRGILVDTDYPARLYNRLSTLPNLTLIRGDFGDPSTIDAVGQVDIVYFFDVLLHQANPDWDTILERYAEQVQCMVVYNQQYVAAETSLRLTTLPLEDYDRLVSHGRNEFHREVYTRRSELHPVHRKPWIDIHNIFQWGITDADLRATMARLGFSEVLYRDYGRFGDLPAFGNHGFVFVKRPAGRR